MSALEVLNEMARSDGEHPFVSADIENESDVLFRSFSDAQKAFQFTGEIKSKISIQVAETNVPAEWTEMINAYPETQNSVGEKGQEGSTFLNRILASFGANRGAWGGGFATACLVLILVQPTYNGNGEGVQIGGGLADIGGGPSYASGDSLPASQQLSDVEKKVDSLVISLSSEAKSLNENVLDTKEDCLKTQDEIGDSDSGESKENLCGVD